MATKKVSVELPEEVLTALKEMAAKNGDTVADALVKAIATRKFIDDQGGKMIVDMDGDLKEVAVE